MRRSRQPASPTTMRCVLVIFSFLLAAVQLMGRVTEAMPPTLCISNPIEEVPLRVRKVCAALSSIYELAGAMESYLDTEGHPQILGDDEPPQQLGAKRPDHMFMRFGRR
ncbi:myosuppressin isoform X3 [Bemisia tabaci]|uniref:myosuppressin isoform X3 n=1 Tax=Bemisia tabaci TaxID=7038 RepID=UPI0008F9D3F3|nr:PREDICTED: myosuppressin-like isoform X4 [Bemisia tabaci]